MKKHLALLLFLMLLAGKISGQEEFTAAGDSSANWRNTPNAETSELQRNWEALRARGLRLLPVPKKLTFADSAIVIKGVDARKIALVLSRESDKGTVAAEEIISRVRELSPETAVSVVAAPQADAFNIIIENQWPNTFTQDETRSEKSSSTDQAYGLYPVENGIILSGQGETGMLYAAVTLRWLIERNSEQILLHPAKIIDWPDFKNRQISTLFSVYYTEHMVAKNYQEHLKLMKQAVDYLFRMKATSSFRNSLSTYRQWSPFADKLPFTDEDYATVKAVADYAKQRGIVFLDSGTVALGWENKDKDRPEIKEMMHYRVHKEYHSWARHDLHQKKADLMAEYIRRSGMGQMYIHAVDGGGIRDPEQWSNRDKLTLEKYGDDRIRADVDMFKIYSDAISGAGAEPILVVYPYSGNYLDPAFVLKNLGMSDTPGNRLEADRLIANLKAWTLGVNEKIDKNIRVCVRESNRRSMELFYQAFPGRPQWIYYEVHHTNRDTRPFLSPEIRCFWSAYRGDTDPETSDKDIIWLNTSRKFTEASWAVASEYAWNVKFPGWSDLDRSGWESWQQRGEPWPSETEQEAYDILAERAAVGMWGYDLGQDLKDFYRYGLSFYVAADPEKAAERFNLADCLPLIKRNRAAIDQALAAFERAQARIDQAKERGEEPLSPFVQPFFNQFYLMTKAAKPYLDVHYLVYSARTLALAGKMPEADDLLEQGRKALANGKAEFEKASLELKDAPVRMTWDKLGNWSRGFLDARMLNPDFDKLAADIADLSAKKEALFQAHNVPSWLEPMLAKIDLQALRTKEPVNVDGKLDEEVWRQAAPVEHFVAHKTLRLAPTPASARLAYDDNCLYLSFTATQPLIGKLQEPARTASQYPDTESLEWFLSPGAKEGTFYQFAFDSAGNLFSLKRIPSDTGPVTEELGWDSGARVAVSRTENSWICEIALSWEKLGKKPGAGWKSFLAYNHLSSQTPKELEPFSCRYVAGKSFHDILSYPALLFAEKPSAPVAYAPAIVCKNLEMKGQTHASGAGSLVSMNLQVETTRPLKNVVLKVRYLDEKKQVVREKTVLETPYLPLRWVTSAPLQEQLEVMHEGVWVQVELTYSTLDGEQRKTEKTFSVGNLASLLANEDIYAEGTTPDTKGLNCPVYVDTNTPAGQVLDFNQGTIEFWLKPSWPGREPKMNWGEFQERGLFHCGIIRQDHPTHTNLHNLAILQHKNGNISLRIANTEYKSRQVNAGIADWKPGEWHHVACVWNLRTGIVGKLEIYLDGKLSSNTPTQWGAEVKEQIKVSPCIFTAQVGSFNSGLSPAQAVIDELRVSPRELYLNDFTPSHLLPASTEHDSMAFSFENSMQGSYRLGDKTGVIDAALGHAIL
jgi:hypothetical protein